MPILPPETTLFPERLFSPADSPEQDGRCWWVLHVKPRQEKSLARQLRGNEVPFYLPVIARQTLLRGRTMRSFIPLFSGYLFLLGNQQERLFALSSGRIVRALDVADQQQLWNDLRQIQQLIATGAPITPEDRLQPGATVEVARGPLRGLRGKIIRTATGGRFIVEIDFIQRSARSFSTPVPLLRSRTRLPQVLSELANKTSFARFVRREDGLHSSCNPGDVRWPCSRYSENTAFRRRQAPA